MPRDRSTTRRLLIRRLLSEREISSQSELAEILRESGHRVTQATISRDLAELGATKSNHGDSRHHYVLANRHRPDTTGLNRLNRLKRILQDDLEAAIPSGNLLVLKVRVATAEPVAAAVDAVALEGVIGTVAGDDTVLVVADGARGGAQVKERIMELLEA